MSLFNSQKNHPQTYYFDSGDRISGTSSAFLSNPIVLGAGNTYDSVVVNQVAIPKSWYNIPNNFNTFVLTENGVSATITIPAGNYNRNNLAYKLQVLLNAASPNGKTYTITYSNINIEGDTGKYTFTVSPWSNGDTYSFTFNATSMFQQMGFDDNSVNTFNSTTGVLVSTNVMNFQIISAIYIYSDMCVEDDTLQEIYNVGTIMSNSYIYFNQINFDLNTKHLLTNTSNSWNFVLIDQLSRPIDLNGNDYQISCIFYDRNDYSELARMNLQIKNLEKINENEKALKDMSINKNATKEKTETATATAPTTTTTT